MPSPVLCRVPRTLAKRHGAPRCSARHSALASKPPQASTTAPAPMRRRSPRCSTSIAGDAVALAHQCDRARLVDHPDLRLAGGAAQREHETGAAASGLQREPAPEPVPAIVADERLVAPERHEAHALPRHPAQGGAAVAHQSSRQIGIAAAAAGRVEIGQVLRLGVGAEVGAGAILGGQLRRHFHQFVDAVVGESHRGHGEATVAAVLALGGALEHGHPRAALARRERRAQRRVAGADDDDVVALVAI